MLRFKDGKRIETQKMKDEKGLDHADGLDMSEIKLDMCDMHKKREQINTKGKEFRVQFSVR